MDTLKQNGTAVIEFRKSSGVISGSAYLEHHRLICMLEGACHVRYGSSRYTIRKGQMILLKKGMLIEYRGSAEGQEAGSLQYIRFSLQDDLLREFAATAALQLSAVKEPVAVMVEPVTTGLQQYLDALLSYCSMAGGISEGMVKIKLLELLFDLAVTGKAILQQLLYFKQPFRTNITATVEENLMNACSLNELAGLSGRSLSSFKRDFHAIYNMPPSRWMREKKLEKARELLTLASMSVTDICYTLGFENVSHFSRLFKSRFGIAPSVYMKSPHQMLASR